MYWEMVGKIMSSECVNSAIGLSGDEPEPGEITSWLIVRLCKRIGHCGRCVCLGSC